MAFVKNLWNRVVGAVGKALETLGRVTRIEPLEQYGKDLRIRSDPAERRLDMTDSTRYQSEDVIDLHSRCEKVRKEAAKDSKELEQRCINSIKRDVQEYRKSLEKLFDDDVFHSFDCEVDDAFVNSIRSTISSYVSQKVSQDNPEFLNILKQPDSVRGSLSRKFLDKVMQEAWQTLYSKCYTKKAELYRRMHVAVNEYLDNQAELIRDYEKKLVRLQREQENIIGQREHIVSNLVEAEHIRCIYALTQE
jgi:hypothetical protein